MKRIHVLRKLIRVLDLHGGEVQGTENLALELSTLNCKSYVIRAARFAEQIGEITIIPSAGGRGRKSIYKRKSPRRTK